MTVGNGATSPIQNTGTGKISTPSATLHLSQLFYVPSLSSNLTSVHVLSHDNDCTAIFDAHKVTILDNTSSLVMYQGPCERGLYPIPSRLVTTAHSSALHNHAAYHCVYSDPEMPEAKLWHLRLGQDKFLLLSLLVSISI